MAEKCPKCHGDLYSGWHTNSPGSSIGREADEIICLMTKFLREDVAQLRKKLDHAHRMIGSRAEMFGRLTGMFAKHGVCEPVEGYVERWQDIERSVRELGEKLAAADAVVEQYQHEPEPSAWRVLCPKGHEYDFLVFPDENDAVAVADEFNDVSDDGWVTSAEPLFARKQAVAKAKEQVDA